MKGQRGQVLLITVMLLATALSVVLSMSFRSVTETKLTKLEQENQQALSAAESAIEKALKADISGEGLTFSALGLSMSGIDLTSSSVSLDQTSAEYFVSPLLQKDEQYLYYLDNYESTTNSFAGTPYSGSIALYFESESNEFPALELTFLSGSVADPQITRLVADPHSIITVGGGGTTPLPSSAGGDLGGFSFQYKTNDIDIPVGTPPISSPKLLIIRALSAPTRVGISQVSGAGLKPQGKAIISEARATGGTTKRVKFFQSYPQIPTEFFVTSF